MAKTNDIDWYDRVVKLLSIRPRSVYEVKSYLSRKQVESVKIDTIIQTLTENTLLDDRAFARWWIEQRLTFRPKGAPVLAYELKQKGIATDIIRALVHIPPEQELDIVTTLARKKWFLLHRLARIERKNKVLVYLTRKGFSLSVSQKAVTAVIDAEAQKE